MLMATRKTAIDQDVKNDRALRKKGGIFYTPPDICDFIVRNAITAFLLDQMSIAWPANADPPAFSQAISRATKTQRELAIKTLSEVKILDPACGEGALLVTACDILLEFTQKLASEEEIKLIDEKKKIVGRNVYGVDRLAENVAITRLNLENWYGSSESSSERGNSLPLDHHIQVGNSLIGWTGDDTERALIDPSTAPFAWAREFGLIIEKGGFDVIVGNPPYGNLLSRMETNYLEAFETVYTREIAAVFLERFFQLLRGGGQLGLIIANSIAINANTAPARALLRRNMSACRIALFGTRPGRLFPDAEIRVMFLFGKKDDPAARGAEGLIYTTDARKFFQRDRTVILKNLQYGSTAGIELGRRSIGDGKVDAALPKVGFPILHQILEKLKDRSALVVGDRVNQSGSQDMFEIRTTGGYWLSALLKFPYRSSKIHQIRAATSLERNFLLLLVSSTLFYLFWSTYGNLRDLKLSDFFKFPMPTSQELIPYRGEIENTAKELISCLLNTYEPFSHRKGGRHGELHPGNCKHILAIADNLIYRIYKFDNEEIAFIQNYDGHIRRS